MFCAIGKSLMYLLLNQTHNNKAIEKGKKKTLKRKGKWRWNIERNWEVQMDIAARHRPGNIKRTMKLKCFYIFIGTMLCCVSSFPVKNISV